MDSITISIVDEDLKQRLKVRAEKHGHSIEDEASDILRSALTPEPSEPSINSGNLADAIRAIVEPLGGVELDIAPRRAIRQPPHFE